MADIGYHQQLQGGIFGQPDLGNADPRRQAALQEAAVQQNLLLKEAAVTAGVYVPPGTGNSQNAPEWASQPGGPSNMPVIGWTAQNSTGGAFVEQPGEWTAKDMGRIPDWTGDNNALAAGQYDMNQVRSDGDYNPLNRAPIGAPFYDSPGADLPNNPNTSSKFSQGSGGGDLDW